MTQILDYNPLDLPSVVLRRRPESQQRVIPRGYFGIGVYHPKYEVNVGTLWRSAALYGAAFVFTIGQRYKKQGSDTINVPQKIPLWHFQSYEAFRQHLPGPSRLVCVEMGEGALSLPAITHPLQAIYLLGAEDHGFPSKILRDDGNLLVQIPTVVPLSMNVATAGTLVLYDRFVKSSF